ncbi:hypothetical protein CRENPOLYSF2_2750009 [Crenothrix polyspora]|uniref:Uncharacterized protein n=1 Tax=Crenothrix polyspora TaxID=360316 RepID=A0A1R4H8E5_9GAMM|nr:hypothetical protein CRENPOLYSF2_2750009 [Crenothrix polyspora]
MNLIYPRKAQKTRKNVDVFFAKRIITEKFLYLLCRLKAPTFGFRGLFLTSTE